MIVESILGSLVDVFTSIMLTVLPEAGTLPGDGTFTGAVHLFGWLDSFLPVTEALSLLLLSVEVLIVLGTIWGLIWVLRRLPFGMGGT